MKVCGKKMIRTAILDQGTVIRGIISEKYEGICCYGVVISASCDIANEKIKKVYLVTALCLKEWLRSEVGFSYAIKGSINNQVSILKEIAKKYALDWTLLAEWNEKDTKKTLEEVISDEKKVSGFMEAYNKFNDLREQCKTQDKRDHTIAEHLKDFTKFIREIDSGKYSQLYYLPQKSYTKQNAEYDGLVVDMQEVSSIPWDLACQLITPGIDCRQLKPSDNVTMDRWKQYFFLPSQDSYVSVEGVIESPRREHFMQQFSNGFVRIGIDRMSSDDYDKIVEHFRDSV